MEFKIGNIMRYSSSVLIAALFSLFIYQSYFSSKPYPATKDALTLKGIITTVQAAHFDPKPIDDQFSQEVFATYMERLDQSKRFFTMEEYNLLKKFEYQIDDQVNAGSFEFFETSLPLLGAATKRARSIFNEVVNQPIVFESKDYIETDPEKRDYASDTVALKMHWKNMIAFDVMSAYHTGKRENDDAKNTEDKLSDEALIAKATKDVVKRYNDWFDRLSKLRRSDRLESYFSSISTYFDPHTDYFSPKEKQDFDINMGGQLEGIGARLQSDGDYTKVASVVVGGPAWKTKKLEDEDVILKVAQKGQEPVDLTGMRLDDVVQLVRGKKGTIVILTVKKKDNSIIEIEIERDKIQMEDSKAKSLLLQIPGSVKNIGYINLPKFYSTFDNDGAGNSCAFDVAQEIKKLKDSNVNGIILDLRNNSGGSLNDVVEMSGFFIEDGPIVQVKSREGAPYIHTDRDKSVLYDGPLIIMVNQFSASASEIIAAAMQDYGRAIIVGTPTFGKGTVQRFFDLDRTIRGYDEFKPLGNIKMTTQNFYRINGGSTQLKGVTPDIMLPDAYQLINIGEKEYDNALEWSEITPTSYQQNIVKLQKKNDLIRQSNKRVSQSSNFALVSESASRVKESRDQTKFPLNLSDYSTMMTSRESQNKKFDNLMKDEIPGLQIVNLDSDMPKIKMDESSIARNDEFIKDLKKDFYLEETLYIMRDMIKLEKSFAMQQKRM